MLRVRTLFVLVLALLMLSLPGWAQTPTKRLILKDGSYQIVTQYKVVGDRVRYFSAERAQWEELPVVMVDWAATEKWAKEPAPAASAPSLASPASQEAAAIDKEEQQERAEQTARTPEVAPELRLPDEEGVWALDTFQARPELVALVQDTGNVNQETGHNVLRSALNPMGGLKKTIEIPGAVSKVQLHVDEPALYVSLSAPAGDLSEPGALTVDTHGAGSAKDKDGYSSPTSQYAIVRVFSNLRHNYRVVSAVRMNGAGGVLQTADVIPTRAQILPGKRWMKLTPSEPLTIGDYALMEILAPGEVNASVWDFRVDPQGPDNKNAITPLERAARP